MTTIQITMPEWFATAAVWMFGIWMVLSITSSTLSIIRTLVQRKLEKTTAQLAELERG